MCTKAKPYDNWSIFGAKLHNMTADTLQYKQYKVGWMAEAKKELFDLIKLCSFCPYIIKSSQKYTDLCAICVFLFWNLL